MKTFSLLLFCLLVAFSACRKSTLSPVDNQGNNLNYFPLSVGNEWVYQNSGDTSYRLTLSIIRDTVINGKTYYIQKSSSNKDSQSFYSIYRSDGNMKLYGVNANNEDRLITDLSRKPSNTNGPDIVEKNINYSLPIGKVENCILISNGFSSTTYAPGIGEVSNNGDYGPLSCNSIIHARINGKQLF